MVGTHVLNYTLECADTSLNSWPLNNWGVNLSIIYNQPSISLNSTGLGNTVIFTMEKYPLISVLGLFKPMLFKCQLNLFYTITLKCLCWACNLSDTENLQLLIEKSPVAYRKLCQVNVDRLSHLGLKQSNFLLYSLPFLELALNTLVYSVK